MSFNPLVEISIAVKDNWPITEKFLSNVFLTVTSYDNCAVNIIDNASSDNTVNELEKYSKKATIFNNETNRGFAFAHNRVFKKSFAIYSCILHNDIKLPMGWLNSMVSYMQDNPKVGILGVTNDVYGDFTLGGKLETDGSYLMVQENIEELDFVHSSCMMIRNKVFKGIGYLDEKFALGGTSDVDFCIRAKDAGFEISTIKDIIVEHTPRMTARIVGLDNYFEQNRKYLLIKNENWFIENKGKAEIRKKSIKLKGDIHG
jgi:GT2 family glycosyltransferase